MPAGATVDLAQGRSGAHDTRAVRLFIPYMRRVLMALRLLVAPPHSAQNFPFSFNQVRTARTGGLHRLTGLLCAMLPLLEKPSVCL
jgi:hypothetical protein